MKMQLLLRLTVLFTLAYGAIGLGLKQSPNRAVAGGPVMSPDSIAINSTPDVDAPSMPKVLECLVEDLIEAADAPTKSASATGVAKDQVAVDAIIEDIHNLPSAPKTRSDRTIQARTPMLSMTSLQCRSLHVLTEIICALGLNDDECDDAVDLYETTCGGTFTNTNGINDIEASNEWADEVIALHSDVASSWEEINCPLLTLLTCSICLFEGYPFPPPTGPDCIDAIADHVADCGSSPYCGSWPGLPQIDASGAWVARLEALREDLVNGN